jgi:predicted secreted protein
MRFLKTALVVGCLQLSACGLVGHSQPKILSDADNNTSVVLEKNQKLTIQLLSNYTTGAQWFPCPTINPNFRLEGPSFSNTEQGVGGTTLANFATTFIAPVPTEVCLENKRSWEKEVQKTFKVRVTFS